MILFDTNVLIYAHREDQAEHSFYRHWLESLGESGVLFGLSPLVAAGFVRIVTHPRFPQGPTPLPQALAVVETLIALEQCQWVYCGPRHWEILGALCRRRQATGKQVADAQHAALAIENACTWVTRDADFQRYTGDGLKLELIEPD